MRNWRSLTEGELRELERLYPITPNRELSRRFDISVDGLVKGIAKLRGWKKDCHMVGRVRYNKLSDDDIRWIVDNYSHTSNSDIVLKYNIGDSTLRRIVKRYGLSKSPDFIKEMRIKNCAVSVSVSRRYGVYEDNAEVLERYRSECRAKGIPVGFRKGESNKTRMGDARFCAFMKRIHDARNESIRKDRLRIRWGLPQKTKLKLTGGGHIRSSHRYLFRSRGYLVAKGSNIVYYDRETNRSEKMERSAHRYGLTVRNYDE